MGRRGSTGRLPRRAIPAPIRHGLLRRLALPILVLLVVGGGGAGGRATTPPAPPAARAPARAAGRGAPPGPRVIVEYADFQCPFCGAFAREVKPQIEATYVATGLVRFEWRDFAWMGAESKAAANAARCAAEQDAFWPYHDRLYATSVAPNSGTFTRERLVADAAALDLDADAFAACLDEDRHRSAIEADTAAAASLGMTGTPTFEIAGRRLVGAQPFEVFEQAIEAALAASGAR